VPDPSPTPSAPGEPRSSGWETTAAFRELLDGLREIDGAFLHGPRAVHGQRAVVEGYRSVLTALGVALDTYLFADPSRPIFLDVNTPYRRDRAWGGDNTDAWYSFTPIDPARTYRISGSRGDSDYFSLTVYNEPSPGEWSNRIVGIVNDTDLELDAEGRFSFLIGPSAPDGHSGPFIELSRDAAVAFTRDYQSDPRAGARVIWEIEPLDPPRPLERDDARTATGLRTALAWIRTLFAIIPLPIAPRGSPESLGHNAPMLANEFAAPYQVPDANYGWSARDACYAFASFVLEPDEALVITSRPPPCRFWNAVAWNPFMATEVLTDARTSVNGGAARPNADGTVTVVVAREQLDHPNAITTAGNAQGTVAFRWFLSETVPDRPAVALLKVSEVPLAPT
jgi:Protein of unknown function (DUF1214)